MYLMPNETLRTMPTKEMTLVEADVEKADKKLLEALKWANANFKLAENALVWIKKDANNQEALMRMKPAMLEIKRISRRLFLIAQYLKNKFGEDMPGGALSNFIRCCGTVEAQDEELQEAYLKGTMGSKYPKGGIEFWQTVVNALAEIITAVTIWQEELKEPIMVLAARKRGYTHTLDLD
jgi:hypothetical protein